MRLDDYIDPDVAYFVGLIVARGTLTDNGSIRQISINFPYQSLNVRGKTIERDQRTSIELGLNKIRERVLDLVETDISCIENNKSYDLVVRFNRRNMIWRNIELILSGAIDYHNFCVPEVFFDPALPRDCKAQFIRGYGDVAGNIRKSNVYVDGRYRVRLDVLNSKTNWRLPIQLCQLLQDHLDVPVQNITWGHPNMGRDFREHQINIFADAYKRIGFSFAHKQEILNDLSLINERDNARPNPCVGFTRLREKKPKDVLEKDSKHLDRAIMGKHFDQYWQICKALGCERAKRAKKHFEGESRKVETKEE